MNIWDIVIILALVAGIVLALLHMKKKGGSACNCGCDGCPSSKSCKQRTK